MGEDNSTLSFAELCKRCEALENPDYEEVEAELKLAGGLSEGRFAYLADILGKKAGVSSGTMRTLMREIRNTTSSLGYVGDISAASEAYMAKGLGRFQRVVACGDSFYTYEEAGDDGGFFYRHSHQDIDKNIVEAFNHTMIGESKARRAELIERVRLRHVNEFFFASPIPGITVRNGFVRWDTDSLTLRLEPHAETQRSRLKLPTDYDTDASSGWLDEAFSRLLRNEAQRFALQELVAAIMFGIVPENDRSRRIAILRGVRNSGKSTIINILRMMFPADALASVPPSDWSKAFSRAQLEGVSLNSVTELDGRVAIPGHYLKQFGSGEPIDARQPYGRAFAFVPKAWHVFATNETPKVDDKTDAFERRVLVISFDHSLGVDADPGFAARVAENPSALMNWAAAGAARLQRSGRFTLPPDHARHAAVMQHGDNVAAILAEIGIEAAPGHDTSSEELQAALRYLADSMRIEVGPRLDGPMCVLRGLMKARHNAERHKTRGRPFYRGVKLRPEFVAPKASSDNLLEVDEDNSDSFDL